MQFNKPKFWERKNLISYILFPFSLITLLFVYLKRKILKPAEFNFPIICIGNIYIGGTGKTPAAIYLAKELSILGKNPVILRKYYKDHLDEHILLKENFKNLILSYNRVEGVIKAEKNNYDSVILDDGFQDCNIKKDLSILCFNENQLIGNGFLIPAGPLRESLTSLKSADLILINGKRDSNFEKKLLKENENLEFFYTQYIPTNLSKFKNKKLLAIAGIGNPDNFFNLMTKNNLDIRKKIIFPDHYKFHENEINNICNYAYRKDYQIITTEKDFNKIRQFKVDNIEYLKIELKIFNKENLLNRIKDIYDKKN
tara:strand:- start:493 stop:1431 length:939 start_codon:yes stop_codon:yes gene_type:complete